MTPETSTAYRGALIVWTLMLLSVFLHLVITAIVPAAAMPDPKSTRYVTLLVVSVALLLLSFTVPRAVRQPGPRGAMASLALALAMCEAASICGLLLHFALAWQYYWICMLLGGAGMLLHFPRRQAFEL